MPGNEKFCQDMKVRKRSIEHNNLRFVSKVRYCCGIKLRAQWSQWEEWCRNFFIRSKKWPYFSRTECTKSCGSGTRKRIKICKQSKQRKAGSGLSKIAYDDKCVGEESELKRKQASEQTENCNIQMCPGLILITGKKSTKLFSWFPVAVMVHVDFLQCIVLFCKSTWNSMFWIISRELYN